MNRSVKMIVILIGVLSILAGAFSFLYKNDRSNTYFAIFIGVALIGSAVLIKPKKKDIG
ncbi:MAG: hypothetical protein KF746_25770 [Chitinophagaceae bacterium]|nr:hypothetical protein [Chitinophagaceae bacterium]